MEIKEADFSTMTVHMFSRWCSRRLFHLNTVHNNINIKIHQDLPFFFLQSSTESIYSLLLTCFKYVQL